MQVVNAVFAVGSLGVAWFAVVTLPRWLFTSINRGCLWQLRDEVFDARRRGDLPARPAVQAFIEEVEAMIFGAPFITPANLWRFRRLVSRLSEQERSRLPQKNEWPDADEEALALYRGRFRALVDRQALTGSWSGLVVHGWQLLRLRQSPPVVDRLDHPRPSFDYATDVIGFVSADEDRTLEAV